MDLGAGPHLLEFQERGLTPQVSHKGRQAMGTPVGPCPWVLGSSMLSLSGGRSPNRLSWERCTEVQAPSALTTRQPAKWGSRSCVHSTHAHGGSVPLAEGVSSRSPGPGGASFIPFLRGTEAAPPQVTGSHRTVPGGGMTFWTACGPQTGIRAPAQPPSRSASGLGPGGATGPNWLGVIPGCQCLLSPTGRQPGLGTGHQWALGWTASLWCAGREGGEDRLSGGSERRLAEGSGRGQPRGGLGGHAVTGSLGDARLWELLLQMLVPILGTRAGRWPPGRRLVTTASPVSLGGGAGVRPSGAPEVTLAGPEGNEAMPGDGLPPTTAALCLWGRDTPEFRQGPGDSSLYSLLPSVPGLNGPWSLPGWVSVSRQVHGTSGL